MADIAGDMHEALNAMTFEEYVTDLSRPNRLTSDEEFDWEKDTRLWIELEKKVERLVSSIVPGARCTAQEWDIRIDCTVWLSTGEVIGEMIPLAKVTEQRLTETAIRLRKRINGEEVSLENELKRPVLIRRG